MTLVTWSSDVDQGGSCSDPVSRQVPCSFQLLLLFWLFKIIFLLPERFVVRVKLNVCVLRVLQRDEESDHCSRGADRRVHRQDCSNGGGAEEGTRALKTPLIVETC